ncbi:HicB family protein [Spirochaetia bacterium]|nr:HicB family protein [Spirochaetia bacterium]
MKNYIALIEVDGDTYGVVFPDFPGLTTVADSFEEAVRQAHEALAMYAEGILSDGDPLPEPRTLSQICTTWPDWSDWEGSGYSVSSIALLPSFGTQKVAEPGDVGVGSSFRAALPT